MGGENPSAAKLPVNPRSTCYKLYLLGIGFFSSFHLLLHLSPMTNKTQTNKNVGGSAPWPVFGMSRGSRCLEGETDSCGKAGTRDLQSLELPVAVWKENPQVLLQLLVPGKEALETNVLGTVSKGNSKGTGREAQGSQQS